MHASGVQPQLPLSLPPLALHLREPFALARSAAQHAVADKTGLKTRPCVPVDGIASVAQAALDQLHVDEFAGGIHRLCLGVAPGSLAADDLDATPSGQMLEIATSLAVTTIRAPRGTRITVVTQVCNGNCQMMMPAF